VAKFITFTDTYSGNETHVDPSQVGAVREGEEGTELWVSGLRLTVAESLSEILEGLGATKPPSA
jgi:hypothetical protein